MFCEDCDPVEDRFADGHHQALACTAITALPRPHRHQKHAGSELEKPSPSGRFRSRISRQEQLQGRVLTLKDGHIDAGAVQVIQASNGKYALPVCEDVSIFCSH